MVKKLAFILLLISANSMVFPQQSFEKSLRLNGDQQYIEIPDADYLNPNSDTDLTIELMFKPAEKSIATLFAKWKCRESIEEHGTGIYFLINTNDTDTTEREYPIPDPEFFSLVRAIRITLAGHLAQRAENRISRKTITTISALI